MKKVWVLLLLPLFLFGCVEEMTTQPEKEKPIYESIIMDKHFQNGTSSSGYGMTANGQYGLMSSSTSDAYIIFLEEDKYEIPYKVWIHLDKGDEIQYTKGFLGIDIVGLKRKVDVEKEKAELEKVEKEIEVEVPLIEEETQLEEE